MVTSTQRQTAEAVVAAFNRMDADAIIYHRSPQCMRYFAPTSMGLPPQDNATYARSLRELRAVFHNFSLKVDEVIEDKEARSLCMWCKARADTDAGEYINEYEFSDSAMARDFFPKLKAAMEEQEKK